MNAKKQYKIKSPVRFTIFLIIVIMVAVIAAGNISKLNNVHGSTVTEYKTIEISAGDTLWAIADKYCPDDMDPREMVYDIRKANDMSDSSLNVGQTLIVPIYADSSN